MGFTASTGVSAPAVGRSLAVEIKKGIASGLGSALLAVQSPSMSSVYQPRVQASGHASADQQQGTDEVLGALVLLQQDQGELHPRLKRELQALVCAALSVHKGLSAKDAEHFLQVICLGPQAQALLESPATRDRLAMLWRAAPHVGGTLDDYVQNCLAYLQGKLLQASGDLALLEGGVPLGKIRQLQREQFGPYPSHGVVSDRQAELEALLRQTHSQALSGEWGQSMQRLNQSLHRHEWLVQVPAQVLQQVLRHGLRQHLPSTALFTQVKQLLEQGFDKGALQRDWQAVWSQLRDGRSVSEVLGGLNTALERGVLTPVAVLYGVIGLASAPLVWGPLGLILAAVVQAGEEGLSGAMRQWVGEAESEAARSLQEVARLSSNCQALKQVAAPVLEPLGRWVHSLRAAAADTARLEIAAIDLLQQHLSLELPEDCGSNVTAWRESMLQSRFVRTLQQEQTELRALPALHPAQQQRLEQLERTTARYGAYLDAPRPVHVWLTDLHEERERWHEQLALLNEPLQPELLEGDSGRGRLDPKTKAALLEQAKRARGMVGAAQGSTEAESGAGELFAQERLMATASSGAGRMTGVASLIKPAVDGLRYGARGAAAALRAIYNLMATQPPNPVADVELAMVDEDRVYRPTTFIAPDAVGQSGSGGVAKVAGAATTVSLAGGIIYSLTSSAGPEGPDLELSDAAPHQQSRLAQASVPAPAPPRSQARRGELDLPPSSVTPGQLIQELEQVWLEPGVNLWERIAINGSQAEPVEVAELLQATIPEEIVPLAERLGIRTGDYYAKLETVVTAVTQACRDLFALTTQENDWIRQLQQAGAWERAWELANDPHLTATQKDAQLQAIEDEVINRHASTTDSRSGRRRRSPENCAPGTRRAQGGICRTSITVKKLKATPRSYQPPAQTQAARQPAVAVTKLPPTTPTTTTPKTTTVKPNTSIDPALAAALIHALQTAPVSSNGVVALNNQRLQMAPDGPAALNNPGFQHRMLWLVLSDIGIKVPPRSIAVDIAYAVSELKSMLTPEQAAFQRLRNLQAISQHLSDMWDLSEDAITLQLQRDGLDWLDASTDIHQKLTRHSTVLQELLQDPSVFDESLQSRGLNYLQVEPSGQATLHFDDGQRQLLEPFRLPYAVGRKLIYAASAARSLGGSISSSARGVALADILTHFGISVTGREDLLPAIQTLRRELKAGRLPVHQSASQSSSAGSSTDAVSATTTASPLETPASSPLPDAAWQSHNASFSGIARSDFPRLAHELALLQRRARSKGTKQKLDAHFIEVGQASPLKAWTQLRAGHLNALGALIRNETTLLGEHQVVAQALQDLRVATQLLDQTKPFHLVARVQPSGGEAIDIHGTRRNSEHGFHVTLTDLEVRLLGETATVLPTHGAGLHIRNDGRVSIHSMLAEFGETAPLLADADDLARLSDALAPKMAAIQAWTDRLPRTGRASAEVYSSLARGAIYKRKHLSCNEHNTASYAAITLEIAKLAGQLAADYEGLAKGLVGPGITRAEADQHVLGWLKTFGVAMSYRIEDTDGENDVYMGQHVVYDAVNTDVEAKDAEAADIQGHFANVSAPLGKHFAHVSDSLSKYVVHKIRDEADEGAINIARITLDLSVPNLTAEQTPFSDDVIAAFELRSPSPPFWYLQSHEQGAMAAVTRLISAIAAEGGKTSARLREAAARLHTGWVRDEGGRPARGAATLEGAIDYIGRQYDLAVAQMLDREQLGLIERQPSMNEFYARAICRYFGADESRWPAVLMQGGSISYKASLTNLGNLIPFQTSEDLTLAELIRDVDMRRHMGLAEDYQQVRAQIGALARQVFQQTPAELEAKIDGLMDVNIAFTDNSALPEELRQVRQHYKANLEAYIQETGPRFAELERRIRALRGESAEVQPSQVTGAANQEDPSQTVEQRTDAFADLLRLRANGDDLADMATSVRQLRANIVAGYLRPIVSAVPEVGMPILLAVDALEGNGEQAGIDIMCLLGTALTRSRLTGAHYAGRAMSLGTHGYFVSQNALALKSAIERKDLREALIQARFLLGMLEEPIGKAIDHVEAAQSRAAHSEHERPLPGNKLEHEGRFNEVVEDERVAAERASSASIRWHLDAGGRITDGLAAPRIVRSDFLGNGYDAEGRQAIRLAGPTDTIYMYEGQPHRLEVEGTGRRIVALHNADVPFEWGKRSAGDGFDYIQHSAGADFPVGFAGAKVRSRTSMINTVSWFDNSALDMTPVPVAQLGAEPLRMSVIEQKYVAEREGRLEVLQHDGENGGHTRLLWPDGTAVSVARSLPTVPQFSTTATASIVASEGMFVVVEVTGMAGGLPVKKRVGGVLAASKQGGQELVLPADTGIFYRGKVPAGKELNLAPGMEVSSQAPVQVDLQRVNPAADPKRASPELWAANAAYAEGMAHDDFALELYYGAAAANDAGSRDPAWVAAFVEHIKRQEALLPPEVKNTFNPFYALDTLPELAIAFAPRNQARLSYLGMSRDVRYGQVADRHDVDAVQEVLRHIWDDSASPGTRPLLGARTDLPTTVAAKDQWAQQWAQRFNGMDLRLARVERTDGHHDWFLQFQGESSGPLEWRPPGGHHEVISQADVMDQIEHAYPDPTEVKAITMFSIARPTPAQVERSFHSLLRGYTFESITSLQAPSAAGESVASMPLDYTPERYQEMIRDLAVGPASVDISRAESFPDSDPKAGAYLLEGKTFVKLENNQIYRALWDGAIGAFRLVPPEGTITTSELHRYPVVRRWEEGSIEFMLMRRPGLYGGAPLAKTVKLPEFSHDDAEAPWKDGYWQARLAEVDLELAKKIGNPAARAKELKDAVKNRVYKVERRPEAVARLILQLMEHPEHFGVDLVNGRQFKLYRAMEVSEAEAIRDWWQADSKNRAEQLIKLSWSDEGDNVIGGDENQARPAQPTVGAEFAARIRPLIIPLGNQGKKPAHLGGSSQAKGYAHAVLEFILKPGMENLMFSPEATALMPSDKGVGAILTRLYPAARFAQGRGGEGGAPGYLGIKPEARASGDGETFSLVVTNDMSRLLFQSMLEDVKVARLDAPKGAALLDGSRSLDGAVFTSRKRRAAARMDGGMRRDKRIRIQ